MCVCVPACFQECVHLHVCMHAILLPKHIVFLSMCIHTWSYTYMCIVYERIYVHVHVFTHVHGYVCIWTCLCAIVIVVHVHVT